MIREILENISESVDWEKEWEKKSKKRFYSDKDKSLYVLKSILQDNDKLNTLDKWDVRTTSGYPEATFKFNGKIISMIEYKNSFQDMKRKLSKDINDKLGNNY